MNNLRYTLWLKSWTPKILKTLPRMVQPNQVLTMILPRKRENIWHVRKRLQLNVDINFICAFIYGKCIILDKISIMYSQFSCPSSRFTIRKKYDTWKIIQYSAALFFAYSKVTVVRVLHVFYQRGAKMKKVERYVQYC